MDGRIKNFILMLQNSLKLTKNDQKHTQTLAMNWPKMPGKYTKDYKIAKMSYFT